MYVCACVCVCGPTQDALVADAGVDMLVRLMMAGGGDAAAEDLVDSSAASEGKIQRTDDPKTNTQQASKLLPPAPDMLEGFAKGVETFVPLVTGAATSAVEVRPSHLIALPRSLHCSLALLSLFHVLFTPPSQHACCKNSGP